MGRWGPIRHSCRLYTDLRTDLPLRVNSVLRPQQHRGQDGEELQAHVWVCGGLETGPEGGNHMLQRFSHSRAWKTEEGCSRLLAGQASPVGRRQEQACWEIALQATVLGLSFLPHCSPNAEDTNRRLTPESSYHGTKTQIWLLLQSPNSFFKKIFSIIFNNMHVCLKIRVHNCSIWRPEAMTSLEPGSQAVRAT